MYSAILHNRDQFMSYQRVQGCKFRVKKITQYSHSSPFIYQFCRRVVRTNVIATRRKISSVPSSFIGIDSEAFINFIAKSAQSFSKTKSENNFSRFRMSYFVASIFLCCTQCIYKFIKRNNIYT